MQDALVGREIAGFRVEALIGRGGMGRVYRALQLDLGRPVALKVLAPNMAEDNEYRERFLRESRIAASIDHPNVLPVFDAGEADGLLFIAMRYVHGSDLRSVMQREGPMPLHRCVALLRQAGAALDAAHAHGLVHRDVNPANFLVDGEHLYLADFGVAREVGSGRGVTRTNLFIGTVDYAAPEQINQLPVDARTDLYALACVFFQCLAGVAPFDRPTDHAVLQAHIQDAPPLLSRYRPDLPGTLDAVFITALAKTPDQRYRSAHHFVQAVESAATGATTLALQPLSIRPTVIGDRRADLRSERSETARAPALPPATHTPRLWVRRLSALVVVALVIGVGAMSRSASLAPPDVTGTPAASTAMPSQSASTNERVLAAARDKGWPTHRIEGGESVFSIAAAVKVDRNDLISINETYYPEISRFTPPVGSLLLIPRTSTVSPTRTPVPTPRRVVLRPEQMIMPPSELPLSGYSITRDQAVGLTGWDRQFSATQQDYWYITFRVFVSSFQSASDMIAAEGCDLTFINSTARAREVVADVIGDGAKACVYVLQSGAANWVEYITGTRNVLVIVAGEPRSLAIDDTIAMNRMINLARQQLAIIDRVAPR